MKKSFAEASAKFMMDLEKQSVYLRYFFGSKYARGMRYMIEDCGDSVRLGRVEVLWAS